MQTDEELEKGPNPRATANFLSALTFWWTRKTFQLGYARDLYEGDLTQPLDEHRSEYLGEMFAREWDKEVEKAHRSNRKPRITPVIYRLEGCEMLLYGLLMFVIEIPMRLHQPYFLGLLLRFFSKEANSTDPNTPTYLNRVYHYHDPQTAVAMPEAVFFAAGIMLTAFIYISVMHPYNMGVMHIGMKIRVGICSLIYRKALKLTRAALSQISAGRIVNLMSNDVLRLDSAPLFFHYIWLSPLQTVIITYLLYREVGTSAFWGSIAVFICIPLQVALGFRTATLRRKTAQRTDERVRQMNEIIQGVQVIKMYTWEFPFIQLIKEARRREISQIRQSGYIKGVIMSFIYFTARSGIFGTILVYVLNGDKLTTETVFMITSQYLILRQTMTVFFPQAITALAEALVAIKRIQKYMETDEMNEATGLTYREQSERRSRSFSAMPRLTTTGFQLRHVFARWALSGPFDLKDVNLTVKPGVLAAVIGPVGAGKTTLLNVVLKEIPIISGSLTVNGIMSYASQEPWLFAGSVRQNILFGLDFERDRYNKVIRCCALARDFRLLPYGDKTVVGERGVSLSGGQRARINLARAVYKEADIYLLDDPLSAVDTAVGKHLFNECITGYLKEKTCILVTHQLQYLKQVDHIILMDKAAVQAEGNYNELQFSGLKFSKLLEEVQPAEDDPQHSVAAILRKISIQSTTNVIAREERTPEQVGEIRTYGAVGMRVFNEYFQAGAGCFGLIIMYIGYFASQFLASGGDYWIANWVITEESKHLTTPREGDWGLDSSTYITTYCCITVLTIVVTLARSFIFFTICMRASTVLHDNMFQSIARASMRFFNTNTSGVILNRFSKDIGQVDELLPAAFIDFLQISLTLLGAIIVIAITKAWMCIPTCIMLSVFYYARKYYVATSRSIKRLEGITKSPVFAHLNASLQGLITIRAFQAEDILIQEFDNHQDVHSSTWYLFVATSRAFSYWLDVICVIYIGLTTFCFLLVPSDTPGADAGLAITQVMTLIGMFQWGMRQSAELENQLTSVERILEYNNIEHEPPLESDPHQRPPPDWPYHGKVEFVNLNMQYSLREPPVLHDLNLVIFPREKIGIVGRTGAGKSSLISALFRLANIDGGILIDNINTKYIGLHDLRRKISIIPQEPVLFSGTMRYNLDPFRQYPDYLLYQSLEVVELHDSVAPEVGGLDARIAEEGGNFSVGQRQLVCLARAIIRNNKVLVLDEATANVDPQTDALIQETIRDKFANCTVLTIAHRLNTVMDSDRVLVMDAGRNVEFDHPHVLMQNPNGYLTKMVEQTGPSMQEILRRVAEKSFNDRQVRPVKNIKSSRSMRKTNM